METLLKEVSVMRQNKAKNLSLALMAFSCLTLASCSSDHSTYPSNADDKIIDGIVGADDIAYNDFETFYDSLSSGTTIQAKVLNDVLYKIAKKEVKLDQEFIDEKVDDLLINEINSGTYDTDYEFDEMRYVLNLRSKMYKITCGNNDENVNSGKGTVIKPGMKASEVLGCDYTDYINRALLPNIYRQALIAKYIYDKSYSSIGNTYARDVKVVKITDRSDDKGAAVKTIKAFINNYINNPEASDEQRDLSHLGRIWLGTDVNEDDKKFISDNGLVTLASQIEDEVAKINLSDISKSDESMESKYTNNYSYSVDKGKKLALDSLSRTKVIYEGYQLRTNGLSDLPTSLRDRIFSINYNIDSSSTAKDVTTTINGHRFLTPSKIEDKTDVFNSIVHYDTSSDTYYLVEIFDVITTGALRVNADDSEEVKANKKERAEKVAYELAAVSSLATDSTVHWLKNSNISYSDEKFYNYVKETYPAVFEKDSKK